MNNSLALELQPQLIEGDGDFVKGKIFIAQIVDVQSSNGGNPTEQNSKGDKSSIPVSGQTEDGKVVVLTTTQYKIYVCSLHSDDLADEDLPFATPYWVNSNLGKTGIPSPRFEPGTFVYCFQELKSRQWYIEAAVPNQLERLPGSNLSLGERCKAFSGFAKQNAIVPESSEQGNRTNNPNASSTTSNAPTTVAPAAETQNTVPSTADDKQDSPRQPGEDLDLPKACKEAARGASFGLNNGITKLIKDIEQFKADNPLVQAQDVLGQVSDKVNSAAKTITNYLASLVKEMKAFILRKTSTLINTVSGAVAPPNKRFLINDSTDKVLETLSCIFDKVLQALLSQVVKLLESIINKIVNTATCIAEGLVSNFLGQLLGQIMGAINGLLGQLSGVIGQAINLTNEVLGFVTSILQLLICEPTPKCATVENYNFLEGPNADSGFSLDGLTKMFDQAKGIMDSFSSFSVNVDPNTFAFDWDAGNAIKNTLNNCYAGPTACGPPGLSLYGGTGTGGSFNAVLTEDGEIFGYDIVDPGEWTSAPGGKVIDTCGGGKGAIVGQVTIGDIPRDDPEGSAPSNVARIVITKQPTDIDTKKGKTVTFRVNAKIEPTNGKKLYRWYYSTDLGNNFQYIRNNDQNTLEVQATEEKDNYYYVCQIYDARDGLKKNKRAKSVKTDVVRLNLTDVTSLGDDSLDELKPVVTLSINKNTITKDNSEKALLSWTVAGKKIRDVRVTEARKYKSGTRTKTIYKKPDKKKASKSGKVFIAPPVDAQYEIIATNAFGTAIARKVLVVKYNKKTCQFDIRHALSKPEIEIGGNDSAVMFWKITENDQPRTRFFITGETNPSLKGKTTLTPPVTTTYTIDIANDIISQQSNITLRVLNLSSEQTKGAPYVCMGFDKDYIVRDGNDSAQLSFSVNGFGLDINSIEVRDLRTDTVISSPTLSPGTQTFAAEVTVKPKQDTSYRVVAVNDVGNASAVMTLDTKKVRNLGDPTLSPEGPDDNPGKGPGPGPGKGPGPGGPGSGPGAGVTNGGGGPGSIKDPWLPPPLFPPGIIKVPILNSGTGYDPTINGNSGGGGRVWKNKCEVGIERVNGDWEVVGIGSEYTLYLGDTVYQPERSAVTLGVPNGNPRHDKDIIAWENLNEAEIKKQIPGSEVFGTPYRIKDMSGFDDSRGSEIFKDVSLLDIKPIEIKGAKVDKGIYFDMTEFDDFQSPDVTFIAANRSADKNFHAVDIPDIGLFNEDAGRVIKKDITGGKIYGPLVNESRNFKTKIVDVDIPIDINAPGWNGRGIYYEVLDEEGTIDVDFTVVDSNYFTTNSIIIPEVGVFRDNKETRVEEKRVGAPRIYGPCTAGGFGELFLGSSGIGDTDDTTLDDTSLVVGVDDIGSAFFTRAVAQFTNDPEPQLEIIESGLISFRFETDDNQNQSGLAIERINIRDPFTNEIIVSFNYEQEKNVEYSEYQFFGELGIYPIEYIRPGKEGDEIRVRKKRLELQFDDNPQNGWDTNARLTILPEPQLQIVKPATLRMRFFTDDNPDDSEIAIEKIIIRDPDDPNLIIFEFNYIQEEFEETTERVTLVKSAIYPIEYVRPGKEGDEIRIRKEGRMLQFDDNPQNGWDTNAELEIINTQDVDASFMTLTASKGIFREYKKPPQVKGTKTIKEEKILPGKELVESQMYLETETPQGKAFAYGIEGQFDSTDGQIENNSRDVIRYYENTDSSRSLVISQGKDLNLDMILRVDKGIFKRYDKSVRLWRFEFEYKEAKDLGFSDQDIRWHLEHVFKSGEGGDYDPDNIIDEAMESRLRDPNFGALPQNFDNVKDMSDFDPRAVGGNPRKDAFGYIRDYPYARSLGFSDQDIRYYLTKVFLQKYPAGIIGPRMKAKLMDPTFGVFSYNPTYRINVGRPNLFDCANDYPYAKSLGFGDVDIRFFLQYVYTGLVDECMKKKLEDPNWGRIPDFRVEATAVGCTTTTPPQPEPDYPVIVTLCGVEIDNPGFGYDCSKDQIVVDPPKGVKIEYTCNTQGRLEKVEVIQPGIGFTKIPTITINTTTGVNAVLRPVFCFVEPEPKDPCDGVECPVGFVCRDGRCVPDPCAGIVCPPDQKCIDGVCVPKDPCEDVECPPGQICINGECVGDPCAGVICPEGYICVDGVCVIDPCYGVVCPPGSTCVNGVCVPDKPVIPPDTPVVRVIDCVGKYVPTNPIPGSPGSDPGSLPPGSIPGKPQFTKPKREVCD